jgi:hypothetical protein
VENRPFKPATHFCIVWGVTLAIFSLLEWNSLDHNPVQQEILSPFIERRIAVSVAAADAPRNAPHSAAAQQESPDAVLNYDVEFRFNGPLFLAFFFGPMLVFQGLGLAFNRFRRA